MTPGSVDIQAQLEDAGHEYAVGDSVLGKTGWRVHEITEEKIVFKHETADTKIEIHQRKPVGRDLPFHVLRITSIGDRFRLGESDWVSDAISIAEAYMYGFAEAGGED